MDWASALPFPSISVHYIYWAPTLPFPFEVQEIIMRYFNRFKITRRDFKRVEIIMKDFNRVEIINDQ